MSTKSKARNSKRPTINARHAVKKTLANKPAVVLDPGTGEISKKPIPFNVEPGHADRGLIRRKVTGIRAEPEAPKPAGAFGGVTKAERKVRKAKREAVLAEAA